MASCAAPLRPPRCSAWFSESTASPKMIWSPLGVDVLTTTLLGTQPVIWRVVSRSRSTSTTISTCAQVWSPILVRSITSGTSLPRVARASFCALKSGETYICTSLMTVPCSFCWAGKSVEKNEMASRSAPVLSFISFLLHPLLSCTSGFSSPACRSNPLLASSSPDLVAGSVSAAPAQCLSCAPLRSCRDHYLFGRYPSARPAATLRYTELPAPWATADAHAHTARTAQLLSWDTQSDRATQRTVGHRASQTLPTP